jgi:CheY-like chemotaxis protein
VADPQAALAALKSGPEFDLVFSDMVMPGPLNGADLAREIARLRPDLPIVLTTGFSEAAAQAVEAGLRLVAKPYAMETLATELDAALAERRRA